MKHNEEYDKGFQDAKAKYEKPHGHWILEKDYDDGQSDYCCSVCNYDNTFYNSLLSFYKYCPYCGAKMDEKVEKAACSKKLVYPMFNTQQHIKKYNGSFEKYYVSCNYGTINPFTLELWGKGADGWYMVDEYYYSSLDVGLQLTDEEYYKALEKLINNRNIEAIIISPCAASFIQTVKRHRKYKVIPCIDNIQSGIDSVCKALSNNQLFFYPCCENTIKEFGCYCWTKSGKTNIPEKENNRSMDNMRYFVSTVKI